MISTLEIQSRSQDSFVHTREIHKPHGELDGILEWCKSELVNEWRWQLVDVSSNTRPGKYIFYFDNARDCVAFTIKWG